MFTATRRASTRVRRVWLVFCFAGCVGGDADAPTVPPPPNPGTISLTPASATLTARQGEALKTVLTIVRGGGYSGPVSLTLSGARDGVTVDIAPDTLTGTATSATATITVAATTPVGSYPLVITPSGGRASATAATVTLTVTALPVGFSLTAPTPSVPVLHGSSATVTVNLTRVASFTGAVTLSVAGAPRGVTVTEPGIVAASGRSASFTVAATPSATAGPVTLTVQGSGPGVAVVSIPLVVTIQAQASGGATIRYCAASPPVWVAQQDGTGPWARVESGGANTYRFSFASGKGAIATMRTTGTAELDIVYLTSEELVAYATGLALEDCGSKTVRVPTLDVTAGHRTTVTYGRATGVSNSAANPIVSVPGASNGDQTIVGVRHSISAQPSRIAIRRGVNVADGASSTPLNFADSSEAFSAVFFSVNVAPPQDPATRRTVATYFVGVRGNVHAELSRERVIQSSTFVNQSIPASRIAPGELQAIVVTDSSALERRSTTLYGQGANGAQFLASGLATSVPPLAVFQTATTPYRRLRLLAPRGAEIMYDRYVAGQISQPGKRVVKMLVTVDYLGGMPSVWETEIPDLSAAGGWQNEWALTSNPVDVEMTLVGGTVPRFTPSINPGDRMFIATRTLSLAPVQLTESSGSTAEPAGGTPPRIQQSARPDARASSPSIRGKSRSQPPA